MSNYISHNAMDVINCPCPDLSRTWMSSIDFCVLTKWCRANAELTKTIIDDTSLLETAKQTHYIRISFTPFINHSLAHLMSVLKYHVHSKYRDISRDLVGHIEWGDEINTKKITVTGGYRYVKDDKSNLTLNVRINSVQRSQYHGCCCPGSSRRQDISTHDIGYVE